MDDFETHYLGEPSPRKPWAAALLALLSPGAGWAYVGRLGVGLFWNAALVLLWAGFIVVWATRKFYPGVPLLAFVGGWSVLVLMSLVDVVRTAKQRGADYVLRDSNHAIVYGAVVIFTYVMPLAGLHHYALKTFWSVTPIEDSSMYPTLVAGDRILVDRVTFAHRAPVAGELVTFALDDGPERIARVIGQPGDSVVIADGVIFVNDTPIVRRRLEAPERAAVEEIAGDTVPELGHYIEERGRLAYHITLPRTSFDAAPEEWNLDGDEFLVLHDNRSHPGDSRRVGPVDRAEIIGRPVFVGYSDSQMDVGSLTLRLSGVTSSDEEFRIERQGRRVQPAPPRGS